MWQSINRFLLAFKEAFVAMARGRIWTPFLLYLLVQGALVLMLYLGVRPPFTDFLHLFPNWIIPNEFFSYPLHVLLLPGVFYNHVLIPFGALVESLLTAAGTLMFVHFARRDAVPALGAAVRGVRRFYLQLILFWVLNYLLILGYHRLFDALLGDLWTGYGRRRLLVEAAGVVGSAIINGILAYSTVIIVVEQTRFFQTLRRSIAAFGRHSLATVTIIIVGTLIVMPAGKLLESAPRWIGRFNPEVLLAVLGGSIVSGMIATFLMTAALCFWYLLHRPTS